MSGIEDRLRDAMAARAAAVPDDDRPLPAPRTRGRARVTIVAGLAVAATILGVVWVAAPAPSKESTGAMSLSGPAVSGLPDVSVYLCTDISAFPACKGGGITGKERETVRRALEARPDVESVVFEDRRQAWENYRRAEKNEELRGAVTPDDLPESFRVKVTAGADPSAVARAASGLPGVANVIVDACLVTSSPGPVTQDACLFVGKVSGTPAVGVSRNPAAPGA